MAMAKGIVGAIVLVPALMAVLTPSALSGQRQVRLDEVLEWVGELRLEERDDALPVFPFLRRTPGGGWIVADRSEQQVRLHAMDGTLRRWFGRRGAGPGEFGRLVTAVGRSDGTVVTVDAGGRIALRTSDGDSVLSDHATGVTGISAADVVSDTLLVVTGAPRVSDAAELSVPTTRLVDVRTGRVVWEGVRPYLTESSVTVHVTLQFGSVRTRGDTIAVTLPLVDTLYVFTPSTRAAPRRLPIASRGLAATRALGYPAREMASMREWLEQATVVAGVVPGGNAGWYIVLMRPGMQGTRGCGLVLLSRAGETLWEIEDSPCLVETDAAGRLYFAEPGTLEPGLFRVARPRPAR